jgi:hypothetical protein
MTRWKQLVILAAPAAALALAAASRPAALAQVSGGIWEVSGIPGSKEPLKACFADSMLLAEVEHRGQKCAPTVIQDDESTAVIEYKCSAGGFGRSKVTMITPRSLTIETQGISDNFPFGYTIQAHRLGDCASGQASNPGH